MEVSRAAIEAGGEASTLTDAEVEAVLVAAVPVLRKEWEDALLLIAEQRVERARQELPALWRRADDVREFWRDLRGRHPDAHSPDPERMHLARAMQWACRAVAVAGITTAFACVAVILSLAQ